MIYYIIFGIILATILLAFFLEFIHTSKEKFKKNLKLIIIVALICVVLFSMTIFPQVISVIPAIFLILYKWRFLINFFARLFIFNKKNQNKYSENMKRKEALEILGFENEVSKEEIMKKYQELIKINHPDKGGSEWITKRLNKARETLLG